MEKECVTCSTISGLILLVIIKTSLIAYQKHRQTGGQCWISLFFNQLRWKHLI